MDNHFWAICFMDLAVPVIMIVAGLIMWKRPPERVNPYIGFRTELSMRSEQNWKFANTYCGKLWWLTGWIMLGISVIAQLFFQRLPEHKLLILSLVITMAQTAVLCLTIIPVQKKLKNLPQ